MAGTALSMVSTPTRLVSIATTRTSPDSLTAATWAPGAVAVGSGAVGTKSERPLAAGVSA
ncbi:unannotated protein [freshwater metagenome]|uniref:Unannotated protein n=1 Tax=freshwater metagenome TaxID=449393 RepID=A0A6J7A2N9_9ZZZZ